MNNYYSLNDTNLLSVDALLADNVTLGLRLDGSLQLGFGGDSALQLNL